MPPICHPSNLQQIHQLHAYTNFEPSNIPHCSQALFVQRTSVPDSYWINSFHFTSSTTFTQLPIFIMYIPDSYYKPGNIFKYIFMCMWSVGYVTIMVNNRILTVTAGKANDLNFNASIFMWNFIQKQKEKFVKLTRKRQRSYIGWLRIERNYYRFCAIFCTKMMYLVCKIR